MVAVTKKMKPEELEMNSQVCQGTWGMHIIPCRSLESCSFRIVSKNSALNLGTEAAMFVQDCQCTVGQKSSRAK